MSERIDDPTFKANDYAINKVYGQDEFSFGGHIYEKSGGSTFLKHDEIPGGAVEVHPNAAAEIDAKRLQQEVDKQKGMTQPGTGKTAEDKERENDRLISSLATGNNPESQATRVNPDGSVTGKVDLNRVHSERPYNVYGAESTENGTKVYVDKLPTKIPTTESEKQAYAEEQGKNLGLLGGALGLGRGIYQMSPYEAIVGAHGGYGLGKDIGEGLANYYLDSPNATIPIRREWDKEFVEIP